MGVILRHNRGVQEKQSQANSKAAYIFVGVLALVAICLAGYFLLVSGGDSSNKTVQEQQAQKEPEVAPATVPEGWSAYGDKSSNITFAYPADWNVTSNSKDLKTAGSARVASLKTPEGTTTTISLIRAPKGQKTHSTLDDWKKNADRAGIDYTDLQTVECPYTCFGYLWSSQGTTILSYEVLGSGNSASITVLPATTVQKAAVEQLVSTIRF